MRRALPIVVGVVAAAAAVVMVATRPAPLPDYEATRAGHRSSDAWLLDRHGEVLDSRRIDFGVRKLEWVPLDAVSPALVETVVQREDRRFPAHQGVDWRAAVGGLRDTLRGRHRGASTLTMQLVTMLDGARPRGLAGKVRQARLALQVEHRWSKAQILEAYLNLLPFRGELQGIAAASWMLAGKTPAGLTREESLVLAALLPHPSARAESVARRACIGLPEAECGALAITARRLLARAPRAPLTKPLAPHLASALLRKAGERRGTTLDRHIQQVALAALTRQLDGLAGRNVRDGAALVVDNATGEVLAYVGSAGRESTAAAVDGVRARRQAGSTLKPFLYGLALERRYLTAASLLDDSPVAIDTATGLYLPRDYDHRYKGPVSVRTALAGSLNVPAVRALQLVGIDDFRERLNDVGYASIDREGAYYGFALALGSAEVSLWEQATAFRALALQGESSPLHVVPGAAAPAARVISPAAAFVIADILSDRAARSITFGLDSSLATPYWSAVKTGTSKDMRDNWCIGFTRDFTVAVWVGNFEGDSMNDVSGISGAAPAWRAIMDALQPEGAAKPLPAPGGLVAESLTFAGGIEPARTEWFLDGTASGGLVQPVQQSRQRVRISNPVDGTIIALDPDIPLRLQRVPLEVEGLASGYRLALDDEALPASLPHLWQPTPGPHRLALLEPSGREIDRVQFVVR